MYYSYIYYLYDVGVCVTLCHGILRIQETEGGNAPNTKPTVAAFGTCDVLPEETVKPQTSRFPCASTQKPFFLFDALIFVPCVESFIAHAPMT